MSREINFRAWDNANKKWLNKDDAEDLIIRLDGSYEINKGWAIIEPDLTIEQYTGLKDKNGKKIYEGDIVKIEAYSRVFQVVYRKWDCSFVYENDEDEEIVHMFSGFPSAYEIIGNIHENPELLGGEE